MNRNLGHMGLKLQKTFPFNHRMALPKLHWLLGRCISCPTSSDDSRSGVAWASGSLLPLFFCIRQQRREAGQSLASAKGSQNAASSSLAHYATLCPQRQLHIWPHRGDFPHFPSCEQQEGKEKKGWGERAWVNVFSWNAATFWQRIRERSLWWHCSALSSQEPSLPLASGTDFPRGAVDARVSRFNPASPTGLLCKRRKDNQAWKKGFCWLL